MSADGDRSRVREAVDLGKQVQRRFTEVGGTSLANAIALQTFLSLFPLLLVAIAVVGFLAQGDADFTDEVIDALGVSGEAADMIADTIAVAENSRRTATIVGLAGLLWAGLGVINAMQSSVLRVWQEAEGGGVRAKATAVKWLAGAAGILAASVGVHALIAALPAVVAPVAVVLGLAVNTALFLWTFIALGRLPVGWRTLVPGAVVCAIGFELLQVVGAFVVPRLVASSSALYGSIGVVFATLAWLIILGRVVVYGSVVNVVAYEGRHGTVSVEVRAPRFDHTVALAANRSGAVTERIT